MLFSRMILRNVEVKTQDAEPVFIYEVRTQFEHTEDAPANFFPVREIDLTQNGWVRVASHDDMPEEVFPAWRVIALEDPHGPITGTF